MISGVSLLIVVPLLAALIVFILRRFRTITAFASAAVALVLGISAWLLPLGQPVQLAGRQVMLDVPVTLLGRQLVLLPGDRTALSLIFIVAAGLFLAGWRTHPGASFFALGMALLGLLSAALLVRPFVYGSLFMAIGAVLAAILIQGGTPGQTRGASRSLVIMTLALPAFLVTAWLIDLYSRNPSDPALARGIMLALGGGFALLLGVVPFHIWIKPAAEESPPVPVVFVLAVFNSVVWFALFDILQEYPWIAAQPGVFGIMQLWGLLTAIVGGILAFSSHDFVHIQSYGVLADYGCSLLVLGTHTQAALAAVVLATFARPASLAILALGIALARDRIKTSDFEKLAGAAWSSPWTAAALAVGGFSVAGIPPLAGFAGRWAQARLLATVEPRFALAVLGVTAGVAAGVLRGLDYIFRSPAEASSAVAGGQPCRPEPRAIVALVAASIAVGLVVGLFPGIIEPAVRAAVSSYTFLSTP